MFENMKKSFGVRCCLPMPVGTLYTVFIVLNVIMTLKMLSKVVSVIRSDRR